MLDRDGQTAPFAAGSTPVGLEFFTWPRRHIESYLLVAPAIRRCLRLPERDLRVSQLLRDLAPELGSEAAMCGLDAKRLLGARGMLARELGAPLSPAAIARCMNRSDLHSDVLGLLEAVGTGLGIRQRRAPAVFRSSAR